MVKKLDPDIFLEYGQRRPVFDVRSPAEYMQAHIPGAINLPLFTDEERAKVGTIYKQYGKDKAVQIGLRFVGPKLEQFVKTVQHHAPEKDIAVHCWRGGMRSGSMAWLLQTAGFNVVTLEGGYKNYRQYILETFEHLDLRFLVIGGKTGSGKTKILHEMAKLGEQIVDLELLAHHKGSAFGTIGEQPQPTVEQFENDLFQCLSMLDPNRRIWIENESRSIGRVFIPQGMWKVMKGSVLFNISIPEDARLDNLLEDYVLTDKSELKLAFERITVKLGGLRFKEALEALDRNDFRTAAQHALWYYDKTYLHCLDTNTSPDIRHVDFAHGDPGKIAKELLSLVT